ncbi:MAG: RNA polymerase sigma factor [Armatimonadota bacterium]
MIEPTDLQVIGRLTAGDGAAFQILDQRYRQRLHGFLRGRQQVTDDEADDIVQDVFTALVAKDAAALKAFEGRSSLYTYLCAISLRRAYRHFRRKPPVVDAADDATPEPSADPTDAGLTATQVRQAMTSLPEQFRTALMLHHFGGMEYHEIADLLGIPANTVATRICRAKRRLRELLTA